MVLRKALVLGADGRPQQLQAGDTLAGGSEISQIDLVADSITIAGSAVYPSAAGHVDLAQANAAGTATVLGLATEAIGSAASGQVQTDGIVSLTTGEWDAVAATTGGLNPGATYYLDPATAGRLTATCPSTVSQYVTIIGEAISTTEMHVRVSEPILL